MVHRDTSHPAPVRVGSIGPGLVDVGVGSGAPNFPPPDTSLGGRHGTHIDRLVGHERLMVSKVSVRQAIHSMLFDAVQPGSRAGLGNAVLGATAHVARPGVGRYVYGAGERG